MFRTKAAVILLGILLCATLCVGAGASQTDLLVIPEADSDAVHYTVAEVRRGTFEKTVSAQAKVVYPIRCNVYFEEAEEARFVEYAVKRGERVKAGDVLMRYRVKRDEAAYKQLELTLKRSEEDMRTEVRAREEAMAQLRREISLQRDNDEKQKLSIKLRIAQIELEQYKLQMTHSIDRQKQALEEAGRQTVCELIAPADGIAEDIAYKREGALLSAGELLLCICSDEVMLLRVDDSTQSFRYDMPVVISGAQQKEWTGRVVTSAKDGTGYAYIRMDEYTDGEAMRNLKVTASTVRLEDVLIVPRSALKIRNGKEYVTVLCGGVPQTRFVTVGMMTAAQAWILDGVSEGDRLIVN